MNTSWLYKRETGIKFPLGTADKLAKSFYSSFSSVKGQEAENNRHGGVFNLEFSPDGYSFFFFNYIFFILKLNTKLSLIRVHSF